MANEVEFTDYQQIVSAWINSKWPANNACPMCHVEAPGWHLESPVDLTVHPESTAASFVYQMTRFLPTVPLICSNCGYVVLVSSTIIGIKPTIQGVKPR